MDELDEPLLSSLGLNTSIYTLLKLLDSKADKSEFEYHSGELS